MEATTKQTINEAVRKCFDLIGLDYDSIDTKIVPLFDIISAHPVFVKELPHEKRLTAELAVDCIRQEMGFAANNYLQKNNQLSGFIYAAQAQGQLYGCIFTEKSESTVRRRFSAAHELAHYLLHFAPIAEAKSSEFLAFTEGISFADEDAGETDDKYELRLVRGFEGEDSYNLNLFQKTWDYEREADFFAAEMLMPQNACRALAKTYGNKFGTNKKVVVRRLAMEFLVSQEAMRRRLEDLGI